MTDDLVNIIKKIADFLKISYNNVYFYGSSQGGFIAINLALNFPESTAIAINSQISISDYTEDRVSKFIEICFNNTPKNIIFKKYSQLFDLKRYFNKNVNTNIFFIQNIQDQLHYEKHFLPAWKLLGGESKIGYNFCGRHTAYLYSSPGGHISETKDMCREFIDYVCKS